MSRQDQYNTTVSITKGNETKDLGTFDKLTGGGIDSDETKYRPGAMAGQVSLGGYKNVDNVVVSRLFKQDRDQPLIPWLIGAVGKATVTVSKQPLDVDGNPVGNPLVYAEGRLKRFTPPDYDSESSSAALVELEVSTGSQVSQAA